MEIEGKEMAYPCALDEGTGRCAYPFQFMQLGEWFRVPAGLAEKMRRAASAAGKRTGKRFTVRTQRDGTAICWRTA
jgi:hypothetical protein